MSSHSLCCGTAIRLTECLPESVLKPSCVSWTVAVSCPAAVTTLAHLPQQWTARVDLFDQQHASPSNVSPTKKLARPVFVATAMDLFPSQSP